MEWALEKCRWSPVAKSPLPRFFKGGFRLGPPVSSPFRKGPGGFRIRWQRCSELNRSNARGGRRLPRGDLRALAVGRGTRVAARAVRFAWTVCGARCRTPSKQRRRRAARADPRPSGARRPSRGRGQLTDAFAQRATRRRSRRLHTRGVRAPPGAERVLPGALRVSVHRGGAWDSRAPTSSSGSSSGGSPTSASEEIATCLHEIGRIARFRLEDLLER